MKVAIISDLHFGVKKSDEVFQKSQMKFYLEQLIPDLKYKKINTLLVLGDTFETRQTLNVQTENIVLDLFKNHFKDFDIHMIPGNHDLYYKNTLNVNSLKAFNLLPNVTVYEEVTRKTFDGVEVTFLPWLTDYSLLNDITEKTKYAFAHLDVNGCYLDKYNISNTGVELTDLFNLFEHVYTGHFHKRSVKTFKGSSVTYVGSPYQLTRINMHEEQGYHILDLETNNLEFIENTKSMKFFELTYPDKPDNLKEFVQGNVIDVLIPYELSDDTLNINKYISELNECDAAYPINISIGSKPDTKIEIPKDLNLNLENLFRVYTEKIEKDNKKEIYTELITLYNNFKGAK